MAVPLRFPLSLLAFKGPQDNYTTGNTSTYCNYYIFVSLYTVILSICDVMPKLTPLEAD